MNKNAEVIKLHNDYESVYQLKELIKKLEADKLDACIIMAYEPYSEEEKKKEKSMGKIYRYWFAQRTIGCIQCLGLIDYMKYIVRKFMFDDVDIVRGDCDNLSE